LEQVLPAIQKEEFTKLVGIAFKARLFSRHLFIGSLWVVDTKRYEKYDPVVIKMDKPKQTAPTHCSVAFLHLLEQHWGKKGHGQQPADALLAIFKQFVPRAWDVFGGEYGPLRLLQANDYVIDKAFVFGVIALSKWLDDKRFPQGIYEWPPSRESAV